VIVTVRGRPDTSSRPRTAPDSSGSSATAEPSSSFMSSAVRWPIAIPCTRFMCAVIASSKS
jgi:hypothetical protein